MAAHQGDQPMASLHTKITTVRGYTAQARFYAARMATDAAGDWMLAGWTRLDNGRVKPVFRLNSGQPVMISTGGTI